MRTIILITAFLSYATGLTAQAISGKIVNEKSEAVAGATISLLQAKDSLLLASTISDNSGYFNLVKIDSVANLVAYLPLDCKLNTSW